MTAPSSTSPNRSHSDASLVSNRDRLTEASNSTETVTISASAYLNRNRRVPTETILNSSMTERQTSLLDHTLVDNHHSIPPAPIRSRYPLKMSDVTATSQPPLINSRALGVTASESDVETLKRPQHTNHVTPPRPELLRKESL